MKTTTTTTNEIKRRIKKSLWNKKRRKQKWNEQMLKRNVAKKRTIKTFLFQQITFQNLQQKKNMKKKTKQLNWTDFILFYFSSKHAKVLMARIHNEKFKVQKKKQKS